jgi:hypothetical protein
VRVITPLPYSSVDANVSPKSWHVPTSLHGAKTQNNIIVWEHSYEGNWSCNMDKTTCGTTHVACVTQVYQYVWRGYEQVQTTRYYTILHYTILYYTVLYTPNPRFTSFRFTNIRYNEPCKFMPVFILWKLFSLKRRINFLSLIFMVIIPTEIKF